MAEGNDLSAEIEAAKELKEELTGKISDYFGRIGDYSNIEHPVVSCKPENKT